MSKNKRKKELKKLLLGMLFLIFFLILEEYFPIPQVNSIDKISVEDTVSYDLSTIPEFSGNAYIILNDNVPNFDKSDYTTEAFEKYSKLDILGRSGVSFANICKEIMPLKEDEREDISSIKPTGWKQKEYKDIIDGNFLYNRCHLIGWQLAGENDNEKNLITGTRYLNVEGMLPFENKVAEYIKNNPENHVLYRVTPVFEGNNLVANGVQMEAFSIEDNGTGICFNIYAYNIQPGITINYENGESFLEN